jgi:hypothetical protein
MSLAIAAIDKPQLLLMADTPEARFRNVPFEARAWKKSQG